MQDIYWDEMILFLISHRFLKFDVIKMIKLCVMWVNVSYRIPYGFTFVLADDFNGY